MIREKRMTASGGRNSGKAIALGGPARSILRGDLDKIGLPTLLTMLELERRSGMLIIQNQNQLGRLYIREGRVIRARIEGGRQRGTTRADAVYRMLGWLEGQFELWQANVEGRDEIGVSTTFLLMEG